MEGGVVGCSAGLSGEDTSGSLGNPAGKGLLCVLSITAAPQPWHSFQETDVQDTPSHLFPQPAKCVHCRNVLLIWELQLLLKYFKLLFNYCCLLFLIGGLMMVDQTLTGNWPGLEKRDFMTWKTSTKSESMNLGIGKKLLLICTEGSKTSFEDE